MSHFSEPRPPFTYIDDVMANMIADSHPCGPAPLAHSYEDGECQDCGDIDEDYEAECQHTDLDDCEQGRYCRDCDELVVTLDDMRQDFEDEQADARREEMRFG